MDRAMQRACDFRFNKLRFAIYPSMNNIAKQPMS